MRALLRFPFYVLIAWATLGLLAFCSVANAQQSGTAVAANAGEFTWSFAYNHETDQLIVVMTRSGGYDEGWFGGNYVWGVEAALSVGGHVKTPVITSGELTVGESQSQTRYYNDIGPGTEITLSWNGRHAGTGAAESFSPHEAVWTISDEPEPDRKVYIALRNTTGYEVTYVLMQDDEQAGSVTLQPGEAVIQQVSVPSSSNVEVLAQVPGISFDGQNWYVVEDAVYEQKVGPVLTPQETPTQPTIIPQPTIPQYAQNPANNPAGDGETPPLPVEDDKNPNKVKPVWRWDEPNNDPEGQKNLLTNDVFREGVEHVLETLYDWVIEPGEGPEEEEAPEAPTYEGKMAPTIAEAAAKIPAVPVSISGSPATYSTLTINIPAYSVYGVSWPTHTWTYDFAEHATVISLIRMLLLFSITIHYYLSNLKTLRGAVADRG